MAASAVASAQDANNAQSRQNQSNTTNAREGTDRQGQTDRNGQGNRNAQDNNDPRFAGQNRADGSWHTADHRFATCVAYANQVEVAMARIANQKSKNSEVKQFAEMMLQDHEQFLRKLEKFAPEAARKEALAGASGASRTNDRGTGRAGTQTEIQQTRGNEQNESPRVRTGDNRSETGGDQQRAVNSAEIEKELAEQCITSARRKLESKNGDDFDKCYMHDQVAKHAEMKDKLMVFQRHASRELSSILSEGLKTTEDHLAKAEEIAKSLDSGRSSEKSGSDKTNNR